MSAADLSHAAVTILGIHSIPSRRFEPLSPPERLSSLAGTIKFPALFTFPLESGYGSATDSYFRQMAPDDPRLSKPTTEKGRLQRAVLELLREHARDGDLPTSVRFLFYEAVQRLIIPKQKTGARRADQNLGEAVTWLREKSIVPWSWIVDETRHLDEWRYASSVAEYVKDSVPAAWIDRWDGEPAPLILCESRSLSGVLTPIAGEYLCPIASTNGQARGFLITEIVPMLRDDPDRLVLYLGDWDHQGGQIETASRRTLEGEGLLNWERLAVTDEQIDDYDLRRFVIWKPDRRYRPPREHEAIETETLGQGVIVGILRDRLDELLPEPLENVREREQEQRGEVEQTLRDLDR